MTARRLLLAFALAGCSSGGGNTDSASPEPADTTRAAAAPADTIAALTAAASSAIALPFRARGNEPGWSLDVREREMTLLADYGERRVVAVTPAPTTSGDTTRWATRAQSHEILVTVVDRLCHDGMSGFAFPRTVTVRLDGRELLGCGGETVEVLLGDAWIVRDIEGVAVQEDSLALSFGADGHVSVRAPCNGISASYELRREDLSFSDVSTTLMGCPPALAQREQRLLALLKEIRRFERRAGDSLILRTEGGRAITARR